MAKESFLSKVLLAGMGLFSTGKADISKAVEQAVREGRLTRKEGGKVLAQLRKTIRRQKKELQSVIEEEVVGAVKKMGMVTQKEIKKLMERILNAENKAKKRKVGRAKTRKTTSGSSQIKRPAPSGESMPVSTSEG